MSHTDILPQLVFEFGRSAVYLMAMTLGFFMSSKGRAVSLMCMSGGLLAVYAMLASRVLCDAMWESVRYDRTVQVARDITFGVQIVGFALEVLGLSLIVLAVFTGRKRAVNAAKPDAETTK